MENGILVALSRQNVLRRELDATAHNLANANTTGFKKQRVLFIDALHPRTAAAPAAQRRDAPVFVRDLATVADDSDGPLIQTGNPLDVALRGEGYFVVNTPSGERYTRNGHFRLDESGRVVTEQGHEVLDAGGQPLRVNAGDTHISVAQDGTLSSESGDFVRLRVVRFDDPAQLLAQGDGLFASAATPQDLERPAMIQGMLEQSNVSTVLELEKMIRIHRAYDQARQMVDREDDRIRKMMQVYAAA